MSDKLEAQKIKIVSGRGLPLPGNEIDTDRIIPARFLKCVTFDDLGKYAFYDARFNDDGSHNVHPFNDARYQSASILIVGKNFGCGSSREHAPQSLKRYGIKAILGMSFAEIFADNCTAIGLPAVTAEPGDVEKLMNFVQNDPAGEITLDMAKGEAVYGDSQIPINLPEQSRSALVEGTWDSTAELLSAKDQIKKTASKLPYNHNFS